MSVIAGIIHNDGRPADARHVSAVTQAYNSRSGSGGQGLWIQGPVALTQWMGLSSPDSGREILPSASSGGSFAIVAEARLDNRDELSAALSVPHSDRASIPDSALILRSYQAWGAGCPDRLEGDFSFALFDCQNQTLVCVQSAFPTQPLYYLQVGNSFAFASLIRPLLALAQVPKQLDEQAFARFITMAKLRADADPAVRDETMFLGVKSLPPATTLTVSADGSVRMRTWWRPDPAREIRLSSDQEYYDHVRELTVRCVHDRMRSERPVVCCLSGGLDSSAIACIAARKLRETGQRLTAISSVLPLDHAGPEQDEREFIDIVKHAEDLEVQYLHPRQSMVDNEVRYLDWLEAPDFNPKGYVYRAFHEAAANCGAGTILDGCGGEMGPSCHGQGWLPSLARNGQWRLLGHELRAMSRLSERSLLGLFLREVMAPHFMTVKSWYQRLRHPRRYGGTVSLPLNLQFVRRQGLDHHLRCNDPALASRFDAKQRLAFAIQRMQGGGAALNQASLAHGIRTWFPLIDRRLIDFCLAVPARLYQVDGWRRNLIRQSMQGILPPQIQWRQTKAPFSPDFYHRFQAERQVIRGEFASIPAGDIAHEYYDVERILQTIDHLADRPGGETTPEGLQIKYSVQSSLAGIRFLRWFDQVNVNLTPNCRAA